MALSIAMFPGQGSQFVGMARNILKQHPSVREIFELADETLQFSITKLCQQDDQQERLKLTTYQQPAILTTSYARWLILQKERDINPDFYAGHSLGEYTALVASGKLSFSRAVWLVHQRGKLFQSSTNRFWRKHVHPRIFQKIDWVLRSSSPQKAQIIV